MQCFKLIPSGVYQNETDRMHVYNKEYLPEGLIVFIIAPTGNPNVQEQKVYYKLPEIYKWLVHKSIKCSSIVLGFKCIH